MSENYMYMKRLMMILMVAALVALPTMAQSFGSKRSVENDQQAAQSYTTEPFRSTSAMQTSGSAYSPNPTLGADGTASYGDEGSPTRNIRKMKMEDTNPGTPGSTGEKFPLGDAVLPLMLMALAYMGMRVFRARKRA